MEHGVPRLKRAKKGEHVSVVFGRCRDEVNRYNDGRYATLLSAME